MHYRIDDAIVRDGKVVLTDLPFADGQHVRVTVAEFSHAPAARLSIDEVRARLRGSVERYDDPFEPMVPTGDWDMLK